jgi:hypothetical protein
LELHQHLGDAFPLLVSLGCRLAEADQAALWLTIHYLFLAKIGFITRLVPVEEDYLQGFAVYALGGNEGRKRERHGIHIYHLISGLEGGELVTSWPTISPPRYKSQ